MSPVSPAPTWRPGSRPLRGHLAIGSCDTPGSIGGIGLPTVSTCKLKGSWLVHSEALSVPPSVGGPFRLPPSCPWVAARSYCQSDGWSSGWGAT